ncbi:MAG: SDR family oxidoreductase [Alphaproteobacteria bacterium]|nr:SDR family oxidoreductase [Alphaproteobacteria bacterium]MDP6515969.1 SDR family oxidoreductase [Alphaproteobacteria bacterium]
MSAGTALVTGAGARIGRAIALGLSEAGWSVGVHHHRSGAEARTLVETIIGAGGRAVAVAADLRSESETRALIPALGEALGPVTCLINNAAVFEHDSAATVTGASWDAHMAVNLRAPLMLTQALAAQLPLAAEGNVVNLIDQRVWNLTPHFVSYTASKAGLWTLTQTLALALAPRIRVNGIGPGPTLASARQSPEQFADQFAATPLGRGTTPAEIGAAVRFVLESPALTGQMIALDGGQHLGWSHPRDRRARVEE